MSELYAKVLEREERAVQKSYEIAQMLAEDGLTLADLMGAGPATTSNKVALTEGDIFAGLSPEEKAELRASMVTEADPFANQQYTPMTETYPPVLKQPGKQAMNERRVMPGTPLNETAPAPAAKSNTWKTVQLNAKLKSGDVVPVWKVQDGKTGMEMPTPFRIQEVADRIAAILNESGNVNHPSIVSTVNAYNKRIAIVKEMRQVKEMIAEGQTAKKGRLQQLQGELAAVDMKLGI